MQENKPVLELKNTKEKVYQKLTWKKNICQCALILMPRSMWEYYCIADRQYLCIYGKT